LILAKPSSRKPYLLRARLLQVCLPVLSLALVFIFTATPLPLQAQTISVAAFDQPPTGSVPDGKEARKEPRSEKEQTDEYRHSPTVRWFGGVLHVDIETAAQIFEYLNFAVIVFAVGIPLIRWLPGMLRQRRARLNAELEVAQAKTADASERLTAVEAKLAGLDAEISAIRQQVDEAMRSDEARSKAAIEEETARIVAAAEHEIVMAGGQAQRRLKQFAAELAIDRALSQLTLDADADRALIAEFALDAAKSGKTRSRKGEQN
jgi:F-type H+-transporting ATPase subunit b